MTSASAPLSARGTAAAALHQLADLVLRPRVLAVLMAFWVLLWLALMGGYHLAYGGDRPGFVIPGATFDAGLWGVQAALAFTGGWMVPVSRRPTAGQVGTLVALATALVLVRIGMQQLVVPHLGLRQWNVPEATLYYYPRYMLVLTSCAAAGSALRLLASGWRRAAEVSALELSIARARLQTLRNRMSPGFLVECLDAISREMEDAPGTADALLIRTGELLRGRLRAASVEAVPLGDELALAALYAEVSQGCRARPVRLEMDVPVSLDRWSVPPCTVTWLVEAAQRAAGEGAEPLEIRVRVADEADGLRVEVADDLPVPVLRRTRRAEWDLVTALGDLLRQRYGDAGWVRAADRAPAGVAVQVRIPSPPADLVHPVPSGGPVAERGR
jgi:hypothetical protein